MFQDGQDYWNEQGADQDQIEMHVHVRPGYTRHAVEPEARKWRKIARDAYDQIVLIRHVDFVVANKELAECLQLPDNDRIFTKGNAGVFIFIFHSIIWSDVSARE